MNNKLMYVSTVLKGATWIERGCNSIILAWIIMLVSSNVHATIELSSQNENWLLSLKVERGLWLEKYKTEKENYQKIMDIIVKNNKNIQPLPNATPGWPKYIPWHGYVVMLRVEGNVYLFLLKNSPKDLDFYALKSQAVLMGRWSMELDTYL